MWIVVNGEILETEEPHHLKEQKRIVRIFTPWPNSMCGLGSRVE